MLATKTEVVCRRTPTGLSSQLSDMAGPIGGFRRNGGTGSPRATRTTIRIQINAKQKVRPSPLKAPFVHAQSRTHIKAAQSASDPHHEISWPIWASGMWQHQSLDFPWRTSVHPRN